jgi:class 3 adenylate cyclase
VLNQKAQNELFKRYCNKPLRKSLNENFTFENLQKNIDEIENVEVFSNVVYIDICDFSTKVQNYTPAQVKKYLNEYYSNIMKYIKKFNGQIDKLMGDGVIVVFSKVFHQIETDNDCSNNACFCCAEIIEELKNTEFEVKASIGSGKLFFCKTGVEQIYEEYTAVGYPYTVAFRLESIAEKNQILFQNKSLYKRLEAIEQKIFPEWILYDMEKDLKGVKSEKIYVLEN